MGKPRTIMMSVNTDILADLVRYAEFDVLAELFQKMSVNLGVRGEKLAMLNPQVYSHVKNSYSNLQDTAESLSRAFQEYKKVSL